MSHEWTQERITRGAGALSVDVLDRLSEYSPECVLEFGSGYSSVFLHRVWDCEYVAFEHSPRWAPRVRDHFPGVLVELPLMACSRADVQKMYEGPAFKAFLAADWIPVPESEYERTTFRVQAGNGYYENVFYSPECLGYIPHDLDFVIIDGPNGPGRNIAFPLLAASCKQEFHLLIDDCQDKNGYAFVANMKRAFTAVEVFRTETSGKECSLWKVRAKC